MSGQWSATKEAYLGRVTKAQILAAVREAKGEAAAQLIDHLKKGDMAEAAERVLAGTGWLPALLRTPGLETFAAAVAAESGQTSGAESAAELPAFLTGHDEDEASEVERIYAIAAEWTPSSPRTMRGPGRRVPALSHGSLWWEARTGE